MAYQMYYIDEMGNENPQSYWKLIYGYIDTMEKNAILQFEGFKDQAARLAKKKPIGGKKYELTEAEYTTWLSTAALGPEGADIVSQAYSYAASALEPETGLSFFDGAMYI